MTTGRINQIAILLSGRRKTRRSFASPSAYQAHAGRGSNSRTVVTQSEFTANLRLKLRVATADAPEPKDSNESSDRGRGCSLRPFGFLPTLATTKDARIRHTPNRKVGGSKRTLCRGSATLQSGTAVFAQTLPRRKRWLSTWPVSAQWVWVECISIG